MNRVRLRLAARQTGTTAGPQAGGVSVCAHDGKQASAGDMDGRSVWFRILEAVKELMATEASGQVH